MVYVVQSTEVQEYGRSMVVMDVVCPRVDRGSGRRRSIAKGSAQVLNPSV